MAFRCSHRTVRKANVSRTTPQFDLKLRREHRRPLRQSVSVIVPYRLDHAELQDIRPIGRRKVETGMELMRLGRCDGTGELGTIRRRWCQFKGLGQSCSTIDDDARGQPIELPPGGHPHTFTLRRIDDFDRTIRKWARETERFRRVMVPGSHDHGRGDVS